MTSQSPPPPNKHTLARVLRSPFRLHVTVAGALLLALVLIASILPVAQAIPLHALTLALIKSANDPYYRPYPNYMSGQLSIGKEYVPPRVWNGSQFVPVIVNINASASDTDTLRTWIDGAYSPTLVPDIVTGDITGPAGYTDTYPWFGTFTMGQFSTVNCGGQTAALVPYTINFNADDASQTPDRNDSPVSITKDINVVLPNAVTKLCRLTQLAVPMIILVSILHTRFSTNLRVSHLLTRLHR